MKTSFRNVVGLVLGVALLVWVVFGLRAAEGPKPAAGNFPHYTVVATDGAHIVVTDNLANKVYFYAIGQDAKIGDEMKFRGTIDLNEVGKPSLKPTKAE